jgi:TolB protein
MIKNYFLLCFLIVVNTLAYDSTIEIVKNIETKPKISVSDGSSQNTFIEKSRLLKLIIGDLKVTTHFSVDRDIKNILYSKVDNFQIDSKFLLNCDIKKVGNSLKTDIKLINTKQQTILYEKSYHISDIHRFAFLAHSIVVDLIKFIGAPSVEWMNKYIVLSRYTSPGESEIIVADYTLTFQKSVIRGGLNIFPKWSSSEQRAFYYTSYASSTPALYKFDIYSGSKSLVATSSGMIVCSDVNSDGSKLLLTMAPDDQPDIYLYDTKSGKKTQMTYFKGIDVGANFVDDGAKIVFVSSRLGYPNIYSKSIGDRKVQQMVYHNKNNSSCTTSGKYIVYSSKESSNEFGKGVFNLYLISTQSDSIRKLTANGKNMYPRFDESGDTISFIKYRGGKSSIGILRLNANRSFLFPLHIGKIQSIDW